TLLAGALAAGLCASAAAAEGPLAATSAGQVQGVREPGLRVFKGIPYAAAPVGARRWQPPAPVPAWQGVRDASEFGPGCVQPGTRAQTIYTVDVGPTSEDCLSLNVWAPEDARGLPVFVWIHGGA